MMADDTQSIFEKAGFTIPKAAPKAGPVASGASATAAPDSAAPGSMFTAAGFSLPSKSQPAPAATQAPSWQDAEALENATAMGVATQSPPAQPAGQGRGIWQAIKDYPGHFLSGLTQTVEAPGNVLASTTPSTTESLIEPALGLAGLVSGGEFPRVGVSAVATKVAPSTRSVNALVHDIGPENVLTAARRLQSNPSLTLADVSDPVRTVAQGLIDPAQPAAQNAIVSAVKDRIAERQGAAETAFTQAMGPAPDVPAMVEGLKQRAREAGQKAIQPVLQNARPVDVSPVISAIDEKLQPGIQALLDPKTQLPLSDIQQELLRFKQQLVSPTGETLFDPMRLHRVQSDIGDQAYQLQKSPNPKDRLLGSQLRDMNEKLIDQIDDATKMPQPDGSLPTGAGPYRQGRAQFKDAKDVSAAFEAGFDTLKNRQGLAGALEDSPEAFRQWMAQATPEEVWARRLGTRADIHQQMNSVKNGALRGETITQIPYNQDKLTQLFGEPEASRLIQVMRDSADKAATNSKLIQGSKTAETLAGREARKVPDVEPFALGSMTQMMLPSALAEAAGQYAGAPMGLTAAGLIGSGVAAGVLKKGLQVAKRSNALATNAEYARRALATGPARQETVNALLSHPKVVRELKKSSNALTSSQASP
jgi:hypothetical protein